MKKKSISQLKRVEFRNELSDKAYDAYRLSDVEFYIDRDGTYYFGENGKNNPVVEVGTIQDVEEYLEELAQSRNGQQCPSYKVGNLVTDEGKPQRKGELLDVYSSNVYRRLLC